MEKQVRFGEGRKLSVSEVAQQSSARDHTLEIENSISGLCEHAASGLL
jgi:hypothetical protein